MRWTCRKTGYVSLDEIESSLIELNYSKKHSDIAKEYQFRSGAYHLILKEKKTRLDFCLHRDRIEFGRHGRPAFDSDDVKREKNKIIAALSKRKTLELHMLSD